MQIGTRTLYALWTFVGESAVMQLFMISILLLITGLLYEIWKRSIHVSYLNEVSLQNVEFTHPHLPSTKIISAIVVTIGLLCAAMLQLQASTSLLLHPAIWILSAASLILASSIAILGELHWKRAHEYIFSVILGIIMSITIFGIWRISITSLHYQDLVLGIMLLLCSVIARVSIGKEWTDFGKLLSIITFVLWMGIAW